MNSSDNVPENSSYPHPPAESPPSSHYIVPSPLPSATSSSFQRPPSIAASDFSFLQTDPLTPTSPHARQTGRLHRLFIAPSSLPPSDDRRSSQTFPTTPRSFISTLSRSNTWKSTRSGRNRNLEGGFQIEEEREGEGDVGDEGDDGWRKSTAPHLSIDLGDPWKVGSSRERDQHQQMQDVIEQEDEICSSASSTNLETEEHPLGPSIPELPMPPEPVLTKDSHVGFLDSVKSRRGLTDKKPFLTIDVSPAFELQDPTTPINFAHSFSPGAIGGKGSKRSTFEPPLSPTYPFVDTGGVVRVGSNRGADRRPQVSPPKTYKPTFSVLFTLANRRDLPSVIVPGIFLSIILGLIPPYMTTILGSAFDSFIAFNNIPSISTSPTLLSEGKSKLLHDIGMASIKLLVLSGLVLVLSTINGAVWIWNGERTVRRLRSVVFKGTMGRELAWYDLGMGVKKGSEDGKMGGTDGGNAKKDEGGNGGGDGAGGLMARFARETDDVRMATSQTIGMLIQYLCTFLACLILSFVRSWQLTLVILATFPLVVVVVVISESKAAPLLSSDREMTSKIAGRIERVVNAITIVKAYNAETTEENALATFVRQACDVHNRLLKVWGVRLGITQFIMLSMFVQGFWFGHFLVLKGIASPGDVSTVFWATLLATSHLQLCVPLLIRLEKGKVGFAALMQTACGSVEKDVGQGVKDEKTEGDKDGKLSPLSPLSPDRSSVLPQTPSQDPDYFTAIRRSPTSAKSPISFTSHATNVRSPSSRRIFKSKVRPLRPMRRISPPQCRGEISLRHVTFHYPSRPYPAPPALNDVTMFFPAKETTYVVGSSGSGKSTVGALIMGLYKDLDGGRLEADEQGFEWLDEGWLKSHIAMVSQGSSVIINGTVHQNIAMGVIGRPQDRARKVAEVSRDEVREACTGALCHEFVRDFPQGYDTVLSGEIEAGLSGGQRQRIALARAWLRDPTVLILDEATSALDVSSRHLVHEAIKRWRKEKTNIIITHDLCSIGSHDFVYVMRDGCVVEQGFRMDLESNQMGHFSGLIKNQERETVDKAAGVLDHASDSREPSSVRPELPRRSFLPSFSGKRASSAFPVHGGSASDLYEQTTSYRDLRSMIQVHSRTSVQNVGGELSLAEDRSDDQGAVQRETPPPSYDSSQPTDSRRSVMDALSKLASGNRKSSGLRNTLFALETVGRSASTRRPANVGNAPKRHRKAWNEEDLENGAYGDHSLDVLPPSPLQGLELSTRELVREIWPTIPGRFLLSVGLVAAIATGIFTPVFSSILADLMSHLGSGHEADGIVLRSSLLILLIAFLDGTSQFIKFWLLEASAMRWITVLREKAFGLIIRQNKPFFDIPANSSSSIVNALVKDTEDARNLLGQIVGQLIVVVAMISVGIIWALIVGWELTLVGVGVGPIVMAAITLQGKAANKLETSNKVKREQVAKGFHQSVSNIRAIRSMSLEPVFEGQYEKMVKEAYKSGLQAAVLSGLGLGLGNAMTYAVEALMFYVGALLIASGRYDFAKMLQVFSLIIFSVTFSAQILSYLPGVSKATQAAKDVLRLLRLSVNTPETEGRMTFPIRGHVAFKDVTFSYPSRPSAPVLNGISFEIKPGECVGIVGASGSGKSTIASLLHRFYEPESGVIEVDGRPLDRTDVHYLRDHIGYVSQHPHLFDTSVNENIAYGSEGAINHDKVSQAAQAAFVEDFVLSLPRGYDTLLGDKASLISGGQAQRLQIARALYRKKEILILDEFTSALDSENQNAILDTVMDIKSGRTTLVVTHKVGVMQMCDRLLVVEGGRVVEEGRFEDLMNRRDGVFTKLANVGEWSV